MPKIAQNRINELQTALLNWYKNNGRDFPWRKRNMTNYQIVIAEVLLQRTKAEIVEDFYPAFISAFSGWEPIAKSNINELVEFLRPIGLQKQRGERLKNLALEMCKRNGKFPRDREELESIPFLGQYIANAIELIIFGKASPLLDINMARFLERYFGERRKSDIRYDDYLQDIGKRLVAHPKSKEINWAVLDYAAMICKARSPLCMKCEFKRACLFWKKTADMN